MGTPISRCDTMIWNKISTTILKCFDNKIEDILFAGINHFYYMFEKELGLLFEFYYSFPYHLRTWFHVGGGAPTLTHVLFGENRCQTK